MKGLSPHQHQLLAAEGTRRLEAYEAMCEFVRTFDDGVDRDMDDDHSRGWSDGAGAVIEQMQTILRKGLA